MKRKLTGILSLLAALSMLLNACGPEPQKTAPAAFPENGTGQQLATAAPTGVPWEKPKILYGSFGVEADLPTIDPALAEEIGAIQIVDETTVGLMRLDRVTGATEPGMAMSWNAKINPDGTQILTFHLRDHIPWVRWNGEAVVTVKTCDGSADRMVTAQDFAYGVRRNQDPATASPYAYLLAYMLKGAADFNSGATRDFSTVGVKAADESTLEMTFLSPAAYNVQIAALSMVRAQPRWTIEGDCDGAVEARGERWIEPGFFQSYGPFTVKEWIHGYSITLVKNPYWPGSEYVPKSRIDEVTLRMLNSSASLAEYEAGNLDFTPVPLTDMDRVKTDAVLSKELKVELVPCSSYFGFNTQAPVVDDVRVRRALSLAVDRQSLIDNVTKGGQIPAPWFAVPGAAGVPTLADHPDLGVKYDPQKAKAELQSYLNEKQTTADRLDLTLMFIPGPGSGGSGSDVSAEAVQQMWKSTLGVNVKLATQEYQVYLATIRSRDAPQIFRIGYCQDYPDANSWDRDAFPVNGSENSVDGLNWRNDEFEKLVREAAIETDPAKRVEMYARAEQILVWDDAVIIPVMWLTRMSLTKSYITRTYMGGVEAFEKWDVNPH